MALGHHWIIEYWDCSFEALNDTDLLHELFVKAAKIAGATILSSGVHRFQPQGVSCYVIIAESHLTVHSWPELGYAAVDMFTCGTKVDMNVALSIISEGLKVEPSSLKEILRGVSSDKRRIT